jgi:nucleotide-binding universal stress UspA family protein
MTKPLMTRILLATDFSDGAACAQDYAIYLASHWGATLEVLHVIETPHRSSAEAESLAAVVQARAEAARQLEQVRDDLMRRGVSVKVRLVLGNPAEHIGLAAKDKGAELVVLGVQGRTNLLYGLIGSTAERVVTEGPCPVLAVPGLREEAGRPSAAGRQVHIRHILAPAGFFESLAGCRRICHSTRQRPRRHSHVDACVGTGLLRPGLRPRCSRTGGAKTRPLEQATVGTPDPRDLVRIGGRRRDFRRHCLRCDSRLCVTPSIRSDRDGDPWPPRCLRATVRNRGRGGVAPGNPVRS